jgi:hypothetical protein
MQKIKVTRRNSDKGVILDIRFKTLSQLLDQEDPTPLPGQELTEFAEETIAGYLDEYRVRRPVELKLCVPEPELSKDVSSIANAVQNHFLFRVPDLEHQLILSRREGIYSFIIATFNAILAVIIFTAYYDKAAEGSLPFLLLIGLITILNWVTVWDTYEYFMYDYRNLWRKKRIYKKITRMPIVISGYAPGND